MTSAERTAVGLLALALSAMFSVVFALAVRDLREAKESRAFLSQCIEKWSLAQCQVWDQYGRRDLAFRKDS
jgi:hypothetical protein